MADQWYGGQSNSGERWNVNLPAVVGVVFVFLLGVVVWVIASSGGDDELETIDTATSVATTSPVTTAVPVTTSPQPMPVTTPPSATAPVTVPPTVPPTAAPTAPPAPAPTAAPEPAPEPTAAPAPPPTAAPGNGDLGVPGHPIQRPSCDGGYITVLASAVGAEATPDALDTVLDQYPNSSYLRTDQTCTSLTPAKDGEPIYVVYLGPFAVDADACRARSEGPSGAYVRRLSNDLTPSHSVTCA
jgi:serine/threonine-protein kinase